MGQRRTGGREGRRAVRLSHQVERMPFLTRKLAPFEVLGDEGLSIIEDNADTILEEVGVEFRGDAGGAPPAAPTPAPTSRASGSASRAGCAARSSRPRAPRQFTQYARNEANNVEIGGPHTVFAPNYGSPFVRDLDNGRRYGTIEDFRNFVKLAYLSPHLHHSGGTVCEPVDVPVNKRHLDMVYCAHPLQRQAVHGLRHRAGAGARHGRDGADPVRGGLPRDAPGHAQPHQRELAARLGLRDARRGPRLRRGQPGDAAHAVHPGRRDGPGHRGRRGRPDPRRGARPG